MTKFLCVQHTYDGVQAAIFHNRELIKDVFEDKKRASKYFVTMIQALLDSCDCSLSDLSFIAANRGPGPFTTLRVVLASCNGLALATKKPLVGVDGLDAILHQVQDAGDAACTVALLDAYSRDVYFGIACEGHAEYQKGCKNISLFLKELQNRAGDSAIRFIGNGAQKYQQEIVDLFGKKALFDVPERFIMHCSIGMVGKMAYNQFETKKGITDQLLPLYLKSMEKVS